MALPKLKYRMMEPPGGWVYRDLDTNMWIVSHRNLDDLVSQCKAHRHANELPIPEDFAERIEASIAFSVSPELAVDIPDNRKLSDQMLSLFQVNKKTNQYLNDWRLKGGMKKVSQEEAQTRADTCVKCKYNSKIICLSCKGLDEWINGWTGRKTKSDKVIGVCACDGIILYATVHATQKTVGEFPEWCWKNKII